MDNTLLLVNERIDLLQKNASALVQKHHNVVSVSSREKAFSILKEFEFKAIIADMTTVGGCDGIQLLCEKKKHYPTIRVILATGCEDVNASREAVRCGADTCLIEPFDILAFQDILRRYLAQNSCQRKIVTVCSYCHAVKEKDDNMDHIRWVAWQKSLHQDSGFDLSHGICPDCFNKIKAEWDLR